jgi:hypothetical protein
MQLLCICRTSSRRYPKLPMLTPAAPRDITAATSPALHCWVQSSNNEEHLCNTDAKQLTAIYYLVSQRMRFQGPRLQENLSSLIPNNKRRHQQHHAASATYGCRGGLCSDQPPSSTRSTIHQTPDKETVNNWILRTVIALICLQSTAFKQVCFALKCVA